MTRKNENQDYVRRLERFLYAYCEEGLLSRRGIPTLGDCAEEFHLSPNYLSDLLRKETGKGTIEFIQRFLVERAKSRLLDGREAVKEIAYDLGFETPQYFSRVFKKRTGLTPSEFRNRS
jgi:AraC-like DNA-binding protein